MTTRRLASVRTLPLLALLLLLALAAWSTSRAAAQPQASAATADAATDDDDAVPEALAVTLIDGDGEPTGAVVLTEDDDGDGDDASRTLTVQASVDGLEPGFHGFHVHENGVCEPDAPDGPFTTAGGHYVGDGDDEHPEHDGDLPVLLARASGDADLTAVTDRVTIEELREAGTAFIVHAGSDNYANIPDRYLSTEFDERGPDRITLNAGDAGDRVACGVIAPEDD